ncbi:YbaB/EbfC family nucleoid-associated protein [Actinokineospora sp.]|uniref:YbaB/EbfC family nucleoid-associated protein n=1 Tax=Actinokineospora sp. TaxID=1872133 RepID=UPI004037BDB4
MSEITGSAQAHGGAIRVEVFPGGALSTLELRDAALRLGSRGLSDAVLGAVREAAALANQRTRHALDTALAGLDPALLGLDQDATLTERVEATTPDTWRQS